MYKLRKLFNKTRHVPRYRSLKWPFLPSQWHSQMRSSCTAKSHGEMSWRRPWIADLLRLSGWHVCFPKYFGELAKRNEERQWRWRQKLKRARLTRIHVTAICYSQIRLYLHGRYNIPLTWSSLDTTCLMITPLNPASSTAKFTSLAKSWWFLTLIPPNQYKY